MKIAFHGQRGSYAEAAAAWMFHDQDIATVPTPTAQGVLEAVQARQAQLGVLRFEMSEWGTSFELLDLLRDREVFFSREIRFHERYNLAAPRGLLRESVRRVIAHPTVLHLCGGFLARLRNVDVIARFDIADALKQLGAGARRDEAAVCGDFATDVYGLNVLESGIENNAVGATRFVAVSDHLVSPPGNTANVATSVVFELHHEPGALMDALAAFRKYGINLNMVTGRPNRANRRDYTVYVEFPGRHDDPENHKALKELAAQASYLQIIGSYAGSEGGPRKD